MIFSRAHHWNLTSRKRDLILVSAVFGALIGSALPSYFAGDIIETRAFKYLMTPKTMIGGLLGSFFFVAVSKKWLGIKEETADSFALGAIAMLAIGRIGCFFGHCCYGISHSWGVDFGDGVLRLPTQLFEAAILGLLFALFYQLEKQEILKNRLLFVFFALYGLIRFFLELMREPISRQVLGIGFYQVLSLCLLGVGVYQLIVRRPVRTS